MNNLEADKLTVVLDNAYGNAKICVKHFLDCCDNGDLSKSSVYLDSLRDWQIQMSDAMTMLREQLRLRYVECEKDKKYEDDLKNLATLHWLQQDRNV